MELFQWLLIQPVGYILNGAVLVVGDLCSRHRTTLVVCERIEVHQVVVLSEDIRMALEVADARMVTTVAEGGAHDVVLPLPGTCGGVAHGIAQCLRAASAGISQIIMTPVSRLLSPFIKPRTLLIVFDVR